jgi:hypothetical protein
MSERIIENNGKTFLLLILPISFVIIFLVSTWRILLMVLVLLIGLNLWQQYKWENWCEQVNPIFYQLIRENQGKITPIDLAIRGNFPGTAAKRYLDSKATEFGTSFTETADDNQTYYFITASILGDILDSSEPVKKNTTSLGSKNTYALVSPPLTVLADEVGESEPLNVNNEEVGVKKTLTQQLAFGSLLQSELAKRLKVYSSTIYKRRNDPDFAEWSRSRDPDGIAWSFSRKTKDFFPVD